MVKLTSLAACAALLLAAPAAHSRDVAKDRARALFQEGVALTRAGAWTKARDHFRESYGFSPQAATLINLASAESHTGELVAAAQHYRVLLETAKLTPDVRAASEAALADVEARAPKIAVRLTHDRQGDAVYFDDAAASTTALATLHAVDPASHHVEVRRGRAVVAKLAVTVAEREERTLTLDVSPPPLSDAPPQDAPRRWYRSPWLWTAVGVLVVGGATVGVCAAAGCFASPGPSITPVPPSSGP